MYKVFKNKAQGCSTPLRLLWFLWIQFVMMNWIDTGWHQYLSTKVRNWSFDFAWMNHIDYFCTLSEMLGEFQKHVPWTNHDVHIHRRAKNNGNCHDACAHCRALTSPVTPSIILYAKKTFTLKLMYKSNVFIALISSTGTVISTQAGYSLTVCLLSTTIMQQWPSSKLKWSKLDFERPPKYQYL